MEQLLAKTKTSCIVGILSGCKKVSYNFELGWYLPQNIQTESIRNFLNIEILISVNVATKQHIYLVLHTHSPWKTYYNLSELNNIICLLRNCQKNYQPPERSNNNSNNSNRKIAVPLPISLLVGRQIHRTCQNVSQEALNKTTKV